jgi:hypothetical protein
MLINNIIFLPQALNSPLCWNHVTFCAARLYLKILFMNLDRLKNKKMALIK